MSQEYTLLSTEFWRQNLNEKSVQIRKFDRSCCHLSECWQKMSYKKF